MKNSLQRNNQFVAHRVKAVQPGAKVDGRHRHQIIDYGLFCNAYRWLNARGSAGRSLTRIFPNRTREYATYDFAVSYTDWYDRLSAPIVRVYREQDIERWMDRAGLVGRVVTSQADFGVRGFGLVPPGSD